MKSAVLELEERLEDCVIKARVYIPDRKDFSLEMIYTLLYEQCPMQAPSLRDIQRKAKALKDLGVNLGEFKCGNTPFYSRLGAEMIVNELKFKVKNPLEVIDD